jgi:GDP-L-fucose synthase
MVGSAIVRCLEDHGFGNLILRSHDELDLTNQQAVQEFFAKERPEYVLHAAGMVGGILANSSYPADFMHNNLMMAANVIHFAYKYQSKKLLFLGSSCIYPRMSPQPIKEEYLLTGALEPTNEAYALAKISGLMLAKHYRTQYGCDNISAMPTNLYGINDHFHPNNSHVLPALIRKMHLAKCLHLGNTSALQKDLAMDSSIALGESLEDALQRFGICKQGQEVQLTLWGSGSPLREFLFVDDLAEALLLLMEEYSEDITINVGTGEDISICELAKLVQNVIGYQGNTVWDSSKPDGTPRKLLDISRLKSLGFAPKTSLIDGVKKTYAWYLSR